MSKPSRENVMAALSAAEHLISIAPTMPMSLDLGTDSEFPDRAACGVRLYFHHDPHALAAFADVLGVEMSTRPHGDGSSVYTSAVGALGGVPFVGWVLERAVDPVEVERLRARVVELEAQAVAACHDAELRAGHPTEAHDVDSADPGFVSLAPGYPVAQVQA